MPMIANWKLVVLERYAKFDGRAGRAEFWWFVLAQVIIYAILGALSSASTAFGVVYLVFWIATLIPSLAVAIRRLHDTNKTGWFVLLNLIPFVGIIVLIVFFATDGDKEANDYGTSAEPTAS